MQVGFAAMQRQRVSHLVHPNRHPHLANTIEPSVSGGDEALCQIILTICCL